MYKSLVFGDEFLAQGLHLKSHQRCSARIRTWLSADQSSSSTVICLVKFKSLVLLLLFLKLTKIIFKCNFYRSSQ